MHSATSAVRWHSNLEDGLSHPWLRKCYEHYFGCKVGDQDNSWGPHFCCVTCARLLAAWAKLSRCMPFAIPMVCREPTNHVSNCYFCLTNGTGVTAKSKHTVQPASELFTVCLDLTLWLAFLVHTQNIRSSDAGPEIICSHWSAHDCTPSHEPCTWSWLTYSTSSSLSYRFILHNLSSSSSVVNYVINKSYTLLLVFPLRSCSLLEAVTELF
jgi:hypothetical protein